MTRTQIIAGPFHPVAVTPDTPAWLEERRASLGASDVAAVLGLSPYASALDVYNAKHGVDRGMNEELAFIGHAEEFTVGRWLRRFHPEIGVLRRGFMARSLEAPWLHASFDRFAVRRQEWAPVQIKTAHQYAGAEWSEEVPLAVAVQIQAELLVKGAPFGWAVAFVGGRRFELRRVDRDEEFIRDLLLPQTRAFWEEHVLAHVPPEPTTTGEAVSLWAGEPEAEITADEELLGLVDRLRTAQATAAALDSAVDFLKLEIQRRMREKSLLLAPTGEVLATWKPTRGAARLDAKALRAAEPETAARFTVRAEPGRQFRLVPPKEASDGQ